MLTEQEYKSLENQKWKIISQLNEYHELQNAIKIQKNEEEYVGKYYKIDIEYNYTHYKETIYIKVLSAINRTPYSIWTMDFVLPISAKFEHRLQMNSTEKFDFCFEDEDLIWFEDHAVADFKTPNCTEITKEEYESAYTKLMNEIIELSNKTYLLTDIFGGEYARKIKQLSLQQGEEENKKV